MGDNKISEAAVEAARSAYKESMGGRLSIDAKEVRLMLSSALPHLQGEAVPVVYGIRVKGNSAIVGVLPIPLKDFPVTNKEWDDRYEEVPLYLHPQPAELSEVPPELAEAIAAGNGTLHGAIDYWQDRALAAEAKLSEVSGGSGELVERHSAWNDSARLACLESWAREPGGLLLHAESGTGRRGLGLGENCGRRTLAQAIDSCATHAEKDSFAALAATGKQKVDPEWSLHDRVEFALRDAGFGLDESFRLAALVDGKQQVGEVQGDALAMIGSNLRSILDLASKMGGGAYQLTVANIQHEANHALQLLQAALASRQPVGHVPDGVWEALQRIIENSALHGPASNEDAVLVARYRRDLLAAPPAQGIDLGQFRSAVMGWRESLDQVVANTDIPGSDRRVAAGRVRECIRLLALLDGRDAGTGVGNIQPPRDLRTQVRPENKDSTNG